MARLLPVSIFLCIPMFVLGSEPNGKEIRRLIVALDDANIRQGASIALANLGQPAVLALRKSLVSENKDVRLWSAYTLGQIGPLAASAVEALNVSLAAADPALRATAAEALGKIAAPAAVDCLINALDDENDQVRQYAAVALGQIGPAASAATKKLIVALSDQQVRTIVRDALVQIGPDAVDPLVESLDDDNIRFDVLLVLRTVDPVKTKQQGLAKATPADLSSLHKVLYDVTRQPADRTAAAASLVTLGDDGLAVLIEAFEVQEIARTAAEAFAKADSAAVPSLVKVLTHQQPDVRASAADALGHIGIAASDAVTDLMVLLSDQDRQVRYCGVRALHELGPKAKPAVPVLSEIILNAKEPEAVRNWAIKTLIVTLPETHDEVVKTLIEASAEDVYYGVRQLAREQLRKVDPEAADAAGI
jgi:HEAT repeat protein